ncbi:MAG TPA: class I SAM-dependent methyltransferase, partial [Pilimelia sp.]|nr:class I SAM-dependent methyltransferase [Pilimelia sp.]
MSATNLRRAIARTPLAPIAAFPKRLARVARYDARVLGVSARWLFTSREHHNYTYDLTRLSREHLAWFVSEVCGTPVAQIRGYFAEIESDAALRGHIEQATAGS